MLKKTGNNLNPWGQFHRAAKQRILLSILKQTTSQSTLILHANLAGNQENLLSKYFWEAIFSA